MDRVSWKASKAKQRRKRGKKHLASQHDDVLVLKLGAHAAQVIPVDFAGGVDLEYFMLT